MTRDAEAGVRRRFTVGDFTSSLHILFFTLISFWIEPFFWVRV